MISRQAIKKIKGIHVFFLVLVTTLCLTCKKKSSSDWGWTLDCPAFSDSTFEKWFPYVAGDVHVFKNPAGIEKVIRIAKVERSPATSTVITDPLADPVCAGRELVESQTGNSNDSLRIVHYSGGSNATEIRLSGANIVSTAIRDSGLIIRPGQGSTSWTISNYFSAFTFNGKQYEGVQVIRRDTTVNRTPNLYKIVIARNYGIIGFEEFPSLTVWSRQ